MHDNVMSYELKIRERGPRELELQHMSELAKYYHGTVCMLNNCDHHGYSANMESFLAATFNDKMNELLFSLKSIFPRNQLFPGTLVDGPRNLSNCLGGLNGRMKTDFWANKTSKLTNVELLRFMTRWVEKEALFLYFDWHVTYVTCMRLFTKLREDFLPEIEGAPSGMPLYPKLLDLDDVANALLKPLDRSERIREDTVINKIAQGFQCEIS
ncbi:hypothetical protein ACHAP3_000494 [Botrytis cinerea]